MTHPVMVFEISSDNMSFRTISHASFYCCHSTAVSLHLHTYSLCEVCQSFLRTMWYDDTAYKNQFNSRVRVMYLLIVLKSYVRYVQAVMTCCVCHLTAWLIVFKNHMMSRQCLQTYAHSIQQPGETQFWEPQIIVILPVIVCQCCDKDWYYQKVTEKT